MINEARFYGGSATIPTSTAPRVHPLRYFTIRNNETSAFGTPGYQMPDVSSNVNYWSTYEGRPMFMIIADNSVSPRVKKYDGTIVATVTSGNVGYVYLISAENDTWAVVQRAKNTARTASAPGSPPAPVLAAGVTTYDPFCFNGDDCDYLEQLGLAELEVLAPLYQDPSVMTNQTREPVRAADVTMPNKILVRFTLNSFEVDTNHPWHGTYSLSDAFFDTLYGIVDAVDSQLGSAPRPFVLEYDETLSEAGTSEHPYHTHRASSSWAHGPGDATMPAYRHVWTAERTYGPNDEYTLQLRFVMEHTLDNDSLLDGTGETGIGTTNSYGSWGGLFSLYVFTDELNPSWVEDSTSFSPAGFNGSYTWNRGDPFATGLAYDKVGTETGTEAAKKGLHPQCVAAATLSMSWHAPTGVNYVPLDSYETIPGTSILGRNIEGTYEVPNGSPWTTLGSCTADAPLRYTTAGETTGILGNVVFGDTTLARAMTLGGDLPVSRINEWLCWENGNGDGDTFLKPLKPGWDVDCGALDIAGGNAATIAICTEGEDWNKNEISPCDGHPLEPFNEVGGSHRCFKNREGDTTAGEIEDHCCVSIEGTQAMFYELCTQQESEYGDPQGSGCDPIGAEPCRTIGTFTTSFTLPVEDYDLENKILTYTAWRNSPASPNRSYTYDSGATGTLSQEYGTWTLGASLITATGASGSNQVRAMLSHQDTSSGFWAWYGVRITGRFENTLDAGCGAGWMIQEFASSAKGLGLHVSPVDVDSVLVEVSFYDGTTKTVLFSEQLDGVSTGGEFSAQFHGTEFTISYEPDTGPTTSASGHYWDAEITQGTPVFIGVLFTEDASPSAEFSAVEWTDIVGDITEAVEAVVSDSQILITCNEEAYLTGYGKCGGSTNPNCGTDEEHCNCSRTDFLKYEELSTQYAPDPWRDVDDGRVIDGLCGRVSPDCEGNVVFDNPTFHGGPSPHRCVTDPGVCPPDTKPVADCPANRRLIAFSLPVSQENYKSNSGGDPDVECLNGIPRICHGIDFWAVSYLACD